MYRTKFHNELSPHKITININEQKHTQKLCSTRKCFSQNNYPTTLASNPPTKAEINRLFLPRAVTQFARKRESFNTQKAHVHLNLIEQKCKNIHTFAQLHLWWCTMDLKDKALNFPHWFKHKGKKETKAFRSFATDAPTC